MDGTELGAEETPVGVYDDDDGGLDVMVVDAACNRIGAGGGRKVFLQVRREKKKRLRVDAHNNRYR